MKKRIGIMGGTFDPIHIGHLILAEKAYEQLGLDEIWFLPAGNPPHKRNREGRAEDHQRVEMVKRAIDQNPHFRLSTEEMNLDGYTYTYKTLEMLKDKYPTYSYYFIIGADSLFDFEQWKKPERICQVAHLLVATRNDIPRDVLEKQMVYLGEKYQGDFQRLETPNLEISSQMLRQWIYEGKSVRYYMPDAVYEYIRQEGMYQQRFQRLSESQEEIHGNTEV